MNSFGNSSQDISEANANVAPIKSGSVGVLNWIGISMLLLGVLIVLLFHGSISDKATIFIWILACLFSGAIVGFLFGIPKIVQNNTNFATTENAPRYQQQVNTNLTEISDWLTKIIVGLGLVNLTKLPPYLSRVARTLAEGLTSFDTKASTAIAFAYGMIVTYAILGFLFGYITTRLYLASKFSRADQEALVQLKAKAEEAVGAAHSALQKVDFALISPEKLRVEEQQLPESQLEELGRNYVELRSSMERGPMRTREMTKVFKHMTAVAFNVNSFDAENLLKDKDNGKRLTAYAYLFTKPNYEYLEQLVDAIVSDPTPFGQYWAIQVLGKFLELQPNKTLSSGLVQKLQTYYNGLDKGTDRQYELGKMLPVLKDK